MSPTSTEEVEDISRFYLNKALGPNSAPMKILKDLKKELSKPLLVILMDCMIFLSPFLVVTRMSMSAVSFLA